MRKVSILTIILGIVFVFQGPAIASGFRYVVNDFNFYQCPDTPKPAKGKVYIDPVFHTEITRITDTALDDCGSKHWFFSGYPKHDCENCDGTIILIQGAYGSGWCFWQANPPYKKLGCIPSKWVGWKRTLDVRWDHQDPNVCYFTMAYKTIKFYKYTIVFDQNGEMTDGKLEVLHDFREDISQHWAKWDVKGVQFFEEGDASDDRRYWVWSIVARDPNRTLNTYWPRPGMLVYDKDYYGKDRGKTIAVLKWDDPGFHYPGFCSMSPSGKYVWTGDAHRLYTRNLQFIRDMKIGQGHADMAISAEGREVVAGFKSGMTAMEDLETGEITLLTPVASAGHHVSGNNHLKPGWALYSSYTPKYPDVPTGWGQHEVYMVELTTRPQPPPRVWRLAHTHTVRKKSDDDPFAKINRSGTKVWFGSGWGCSLADKGCELDVYQINLPPTWYEDLSQVDAKIRR